MFGSQLLDTAIGLFFVLLLVSLLVTVANEIVAALFRSRARFLRNGIQRLVGKDWMSAMYQHPLIAGMSLTAAGGPSYIPSRTYATVLIELLHQSEPSIRDARNALRRVLQLVYARTATVGDLKDALIKLSPLSASTSKAAKEAKDSLESAQRMVSTGSTSERCKIGISQLEQISNSIKEVPALAELRKRLETVATRIAALPKECDPAEIEMEMKALVKTVPYVGGYHRYDS